MQSTAAKACRQIVNSLLAASAATVTTATATAFTGPSFVDRKCPTVVLLPIDRGNGCLGVLIILHFDKAKTFAPAGVAVHDHLSTLNRPDFTKHLVEIRARNVVTQIATIKLLSHDSTPAIRNNAQP